MQTTELQLNSPVQSANPFIVILVYVRTIIIQIGTCIVAYRIFLPIVSYIDGCNMAANNECCKNIPGILLAH
jgi:hypothetical protein